MRIQLVAVVAAIAACGGPPKTIKSDLPVPTLEKPVDRILAMLPQGAQIVVELDLARLRANAVIGAMVTRAFAAGVKLPGSAPASPLATADLVVLAAYGVGTANAATVTMLASKEAVPDATRVAEGIYALGPEDWVGQIALRGALVDTDGKIRAQPELLSLRDHAMPPGAPGASLRITARLPFDARVALARQTGLESAPGQLSIWGDVVDDLAIIVDADSSDPGEKITKKSVARLQTTVRGALASLAGDPFVQALGLPRSLAGAKLVTRGTWIRAIIAIGPEHLQRVVARANELLKEPASGAGGETTKEPPSSSGAVRQ